MRIGTEVDPYSLQPKNDMSAFLHYFGDKLTDEQEVLELRAKVGQLVLENDFLERGLERTHGPREDWLLDNPWTCGQSVYSDSAA